MTESKYRALVYARVMSSSVVPHVVPYSTPPAGAPNVVVIVLDDVGFGQLGCFGSPIHTPNIDRLAANGLRFNRFHVTSICSSTRAALLTGRNHHAVGVGATQETSFALPGYNGRIPRSAATLARILKENGYNTMAVGKWHLTPQAEYSAAGPFERWPLGMGFERYYGFLGAETNHWAPELVRDNTPIPTPDTPDYHLTEDLAHQAIDMMRSQHAAAPDKPFLLWFATGAAHAPHHVTREWFEPYTGKFDEGWEVLRERTFREQLRNGVIPPDTTLTPRPSWVPEWSSLSEGERRLFARYMEVFAGFVTHTDAQIGRILDHIEASGQADNTIVMLMSDNGTSSEGGPTGTLNEAASWLGDHATVEEALEHIDDRRTQPHQPLPVGLGLGGEQSVPAMEALFVARRRSGSADRALAVRNRRCRIDSQPIHARRRHHSHLARCHWAIDARRCRRGRSTACRRGRCARDLH